MPDARKGSTDRLAGEHDPGAREAEAAEGGPAVPELSPGREKEVLTDLAGRDWRRVLAASDLHLGPGKDPDTEVYAPRENFFAGAAFRRWLAHERSEADGPCLLVLNGDILDFARIQRVPETDADYDRWSSWLARLGRRDEARSLPRPLPRVERKHGLRTHDTRTVWKLGVIARGHPEFFGALGAWVAAGGGFIAIRGNHDPEWHWPLVRQALRDLLVREGAAPEAVLERVAFSDDSARVANLHLEHGHEHEAMTRFDGPPTLEEAPDQIRLPLGSFVNRYFINHIERLDPFLDNVKPVHAALSELIRRRPLRILFLYGSAVKFIGRALVIPRPLSRAWALLALGAFGIPVVTVVLVVLWLFVPDARSWLLQTLPMLGSGWVRAAGTTGGIALPALLPWIFRLGREVLRTLGIVGDEDPLAEAAQEFAAEMKAEAGAPKRPYVVMGHTHRQTVRLLEVAGAGPAYYVNTGTWTPLWPRDREDLAGKILHTFVRFEPGPDGELRHRSLEWDDAAGEARAARILGSWTSG